MKSKFLSMAQEALWGLAPDCLPAPRGAPFPIIHQSPSHWVFTLSQSFADSSDWNNLPSALAVGVPSQTLGSVFMSLLQRSLPWPSLRKIPACSFSAMSFVPSIVFTECVMGPVIGVFIQILSAIPVGSRRHRAGITAVVFIPSPARCLLQSTCSTNTSRWLDNWVTMRLLPPFTGCHNLSCTLRLMSNVISVQSSIPLFKMNPHFEPLYCLFKAFVLRNNVWISWENRLWGKTDLGGILV